MKITTKDTEIKSLVSKMGLSESASSLSEADLRTKLESQVKGKLDIRKNENGDFHVRRVLAG